MRGIIGQCYLDETDGKDDGGERGLAAATAWTSDVAETMEGKVGSCTKGRKAPIIENRCRE